MKGYIYKLWSLQTDEIYIGSTKQKYLSDRMSGHRSDYKKYLNKKYCYVTSFELIKFDDCKIECMEVVEFNDIVELRAKEGEWIRKIDCVNKVIPCRTKQEYYQDNIEKIKEYYDTHKEQISEYNKEYRDTHKEQIAEYQKEYQKEYNETNKEKIYENNKEYYQDNKQQIHERHKEYYQNNKQIITCECGCKITNISLNKHIKSKKHINLLTANRTNECLLKASDVTVMSAC